MKTRSEQFGVMPDGRQVQLFSLINDRGLEVKITNYGGVIAAIKAPVREGQIDDVVLCHDTLEGYLNRSRYFGAVVGRYANRIAHGRFTLNGDSYSLAINNGANHLHGGLKGFDKVLWEAREVSDGLQIEYLSKDGDQGYPGNVRATVNYSLTPANELRIEYLATTDKETIINLTNHSYFNLAGEGTILGHELTLNADAFTPVDRGLIPTGEIRGVANTPMDFTSVAAVGTRIGVNYEHVKLAVGYDPNFFLRRGAGAAKIMPTKEISLVSPTTFSCGGAEENNREKPQDFTNPGAAGSWKF